MTPFGLICPASTGHLNTILLLGKELQRRGHRVTLFGILDAQANTLAAGLEFQAIGESEYPGQNGAITYPTRETEWNDSISSSQTYTSGINFRSFSGKSR
ncbi:hypothetical protein [Microcoleus sp. Pol10D4]|uniref:hypothetical protein n=1 Tax=Microcoleus sp. Pol10D4 TaxID=3055387 RepID=UPI002FCF1276